MRNVIFDIKLLRARVTIAGRSFSLLARPDKMYSVHARTQQRSTFQLESRIRVSEKHFEVFWIALPRSI